MTTPVFFLSGLLLHIIGLTTIAGTTLVGYIIFRQFRTAYTQDKQKGFAIMQAISKLPALAGIGLGLQVISGVMMLVSSGGGYGQQVWFKIKLILVVLIIVITTVLIRGMQKRLHQWVLDDMIHGAKTRQIANIADRIGYIQLILLSFFILIFILSVFKFN